MSVREEALKLHSEKRGKIEIALKVPIRNLADLNLAYTPGVAEPCKEIAKNPDDAYVYTNRGNMVAVVTDGSAVLGLGNLGPLGAMPVMEGKAALFKSFANVDAFPICLDTNDVDEIVATVKHIAPSFGGVNLEDISAPRCFEIERRLVEELDIPVFHDDQHGTAIVVLAALYNALRVVKKDIKDIRVVINGIGAAGSAIARLLLAAGVTKMRLVDVAGQLYPGGPKNNPMQEELARIVNPEGEKRNLSDALVDSDVFIGVSIGNLLTAKDVARMNKDAIVFAMANPTPEIFPDEAKAGGAAVVGTGRGDFPNQINNVLVFPGIFRGALDARARDFTEEIRLAAARGIAEMVTDKELTADYIIPDPFDRRVPDAVAAAVKAVVGKK